MSKTIFNKYFQAVTESDTLRISGKVSRVVGLVVEGEGPDLPVGAVCEIFPEGSGDPNSPAEPIGAEVVGFDGNKIFVMPYGDTRGISSGCLIRSKSHTATVPVDDSILGRVINALGEPIDGKGPLLLKDETPLYADPVSPISRRRITEPIDLGIRAVNGLVTVGRGQRMGILSGTGIGKSVLLGMMAKYTDADINVIALIGERGREVRDFIEQNIGEEGMKRSVVVVATSDSPPLLRKRGAFVATAIAEYFRDRGKNVLLMMDSITRFAMAQREIGLSIGEPPATKGYTPSVYSLLPKLLERAGSSDGPGSITGLYTVLIEGDDISEPISDATRAILDGHLVLSRRLASLGHYPAIDILNSISRVMVDVVPPDHMEAALRMRELYAVYSEAEDLINIGAYVAGSNPRIDEAISKIDTINSYLRQRITEKVTLFESMEVASMISGGATVAQET